MNIKKTIILILALGVLLAVAFYFSNKNENKIISEQEYQLEKNEIETTYKSYENGQELVVVYNNQNNTAKLYSGQSDEIIFSLSPSASGAKYENKERGTVLWSKGDDVVLYLNESPIFIGGVKQ